MHRLCILVLATSFFRWPSTAYAVPDRCLVPPPRDTYGCEYPRYVFYNNPRGYCDRFVDWSCGRGNSWSRNAFETREECEVVCGVRGDRPTPVDITGFVALSNSPLIAGGRGRDVFLRCSLVEGHLENFTGYATILLEGGPQEATTNFAHGGITIPSEATQDWPTALPTLPATGDLPTTGDLPAASDLPTTSDLLAASDTPTTSDLPATGDLPPDTQESITVTMVTAEATQGTDADAPSVPQTNERPTDDTPTTPPHVDDLPTDDAELLKEELQSLLLMNEVVTIASEPSTATTSASGEGEESPSRGNGNPSGDEGSLSGGTGNSSGDEGSTSGDRGTPSAHVGNPSVDEPLVKMHISVLLPSQTEGESDFGGNNLVSTPLPTELAEVQNALGDHYHQIAQEKEKAFDYISIGVVTLALAMYLVVMGAIVGVAYALRKKKRSGSSDNDTRRDGPLSEMIMIDLT